LMCLLVGVLLVMVPALADVVNIPMISANLISLLEYVFSSIFMIIMRC